MTRCPTCGTTYSDDARFCTRDGTQLVAAWERGGARNAAPTLVGKTLAGKYVVQKKIGEGGMSFVYLATDGTPTGRVAIKVLSSALSHDENAMARLRREAGFGMRLAHPNVCHIIHVGETEDGLVFVVMPFVEGEVLADRTARLGRIPLDDAAGIVRDIAAGLTAAHALEIVHRDLKPENVIVRTLADGSLQAVVMDFGLAKERIAGQDLQKLTATGIILGTPEFMSPEQLRGKPLDARSDVYALALLAYEMLDRRAAVRGTHAARVDDRATAQGPDADSRTTAAARRLRGDRACAGERPRARTRPALRHGERVRGRVRRGRGQPQPVAGGPTGGSSANCSAIDSSPRRDVPSRCWRRAARSARRSRVRIGRRSTSPTTH